MGPAVLAPGRGEQVRPRDPACTSHVQRGQGGKGGERRERQEASVQAPKVRFDSKLSRTQWKALDRCVHVHVRDLMLLKPQGENCLTSMCARVAEKR